jgi:hypothetical protein
VHLILAGATFAVAALLAFRFLQPPVAAFVAFLGGWLLLPVGSYPSDANGQTFAYWITGVAVPSPVGPSKAVLIPLVVLAASGLRDRAAWARLRWRTPDACVVLACLWPLAILLVPRSGEADPAPGVSSLYLAAAWGGSWLVGRLYGATLVNRRLLAQALVWSVVACLPFALLEGLWGPQIYGWLYGPHPFATDGHDRALGFRPIGFFEHGNQYGIWVTLGAVVAPLLALTSRQRDPWRWIVVGVVIAVALAAQSLGAILLGVGCWAALWMSRRVSLRTLSGAGALVAGLTAAVYLSGALPIQHWARQTAAGQKLLEVFRGAGMGSFAWRISQDQKVLDLVRARPITGHGRWNWWAERKTRPWGLAVLSAGQFGLVGMAGLFGMLLLPAGRVLALAPRGDPWRPQSIDLLLALVIMAAAVDALLNAFIYFPALLIAGALAEHAPVAEDA